MGTTSYLSLDALAARLGLSRPYLKEQAGRGTIPCLRVGGRMRFTEAAVREALAKLANDLGGNGNAA
jgi:excisionase family DNA binding protein